jgi:hypothetical protein
MINLENGENIKPRGEDQSFQLVAHRLCTLVRLPRTANTVLILDKRSEKKQRQEMWDPGNENRPSNLGV